RLAVAAGVGGTRGQSASGAPGDQAVDRGLAGVVIAEDLAEEGDQGDHRGEDPVAGLAGVRGDDAGEARGVEGAGTEQRGMEDKGAEEGAKLSGGPGGVRIGHGRSSWSVESGGTPAIGDEEGLLCTSPSVGMSYGSVSAIHL